MAQQDRIAQREFTCPRCGAEPGKSCSEAGTCVELPTA
jgi:transcription elongation factor Elf1